MLLKIVHIIFILSTFNLLSYGIHISEYNETNAILSMNSQLSELRAEQERHDKLIDGLFKYLNIQDRQEKFLDQLLKAMDVQSFRTDLEKQLKLMESNFQLLKMEQERQKNDELVKEKDIQSLKSEQELLRRIIDGPVKKSNLRNCNEAKSTGIHDIVIPNFSSQPFTVACDAETREGGWTLILRRMDGSVNFQRTWNAYKKGFGDLDGEFFLGLDKIHALTAERNQELLVLLEDNKGTKAFEKYEAFAIGDEKEHYVLYKLGKASGTAGDALRTHRAMKFSTLDRDNDKAEGDCAKHYTGGWWYNSCHFSLLTGMYNNNTQGMGVIWNTFRSNTDSLKTAVMMIRPKK